MNPCEMDFGIRLVLLVLDVLQLLYELRELKNTLETILLPTFKIFFFAAIHLKDWAVRSSHLNIQRTCGLLSKMDPEKLIVS